MPQIQDAIPQISVARMCWVVARRDAVCVARLLHREAGREQRLLAGPGAVLDNFFHVMRVLGMTRLL
jgi:hypothetical protein